MTPGEPLIRWEWIASHLGDVWQRLVEHVTLAALALAIGFVISFALALLIRRYARLHDPITWSTGALYTIPSLALFAFLVPITGLSLLTAEIGLVSYTLLILTRSIVGGLRAAAISTIGLVTVTALIGQGGFGFFILDGIQRFFSTPLLVGAVLSVALGAAADAALVLLQRRLAPWTAQRT